MKEAARKSAVAFHTVDTSLDLAANFQSNDGLSLPTSVKSSCVYIIPFTPIMKVEMCPRRHPLSRFSHYPIRILSFFSGFERFSWPVARLGKPRSLEISVKRGAARVKRRLLHGNREKVRGEHVKIHGRVVPGCDARLASYFVIPILASRVSKKNSR